MSRAFVKARFREAQLAMGGAVGFIRASPAAFLLAETHVGECAFIQQDESVVQDALKRLTYVHRVDHTPEVDDWAMEELMFSLDHIDELSGYQATAIHKMNNWMALGLENTTETWG